MVRVIELQDPRSAVEATGPSPESSGEVCVVVLDPIGALVPEDCACCRAPAAASRVERQLVGEGSLIVPYCRACHRHAAADSTRDLAVVLASSLLALALATGLPIALAWARLDVLLTLVLFGAALPLGLALRRSRARRPHTTRARAVWWSPLGLICTNPSWARRLADLNRVDCQPSAKQKRRFTAWMLAGPMLGTALTPFIHWLCHPLVRVVNLTETELVISADEHPLAAVGPTSVEHPEAGVELRAPAGRRVLRAHDRSGHLVAQDTVLVRSGRQHLYAPGEHDQCFWIETTGYGRDGPQTPTVRELSRNRHFWVLPRGIDTWFDRNPSQADDARASGGRLTALRQGRCRDLPAPN